VRMSDYADEVGMPALLSAPSVRLGFWVEHYQHNIAELEQPPMADDILGMTMHHPVGILRKTSKRSASEVHDPGDLHIIASGSDGRWQFDQPLDSMHLRMAPAFLLRAFGEEGEGVKLADVDLAADPRVTPLLGSLLAKVQTDRRVDLAAESMAIQVARLLLDQSSSGKLYRLTRKSGLSARELRLVDDYLHHRMAEPVSIADIAEEAMLSPFHLMRLFKVTTGDSLYNHSLAIRLERAKDLLIGTRLTVAEIGLETGFHDESHFIRHFKKRFGVTPRQVR
jgi:AraC family transcriptional regulator